MQKPCSGYILLFYFNDPDFSSLSWIQHFEMYETPIKKLAIKHKTTCLKWIQATK